MAETQNLTADGSTTGLALEGLISVGAYGTFGSGTLTFEMSYDNGTTYFAMTDAAGNNFELTADGANNINVGKDVLVRGTLSGATSPDIDITYTDIRNTSKL